MIPTKIIHCGERVLSSVCAPVSACKPPTLNFMKLEYKVILKDTLENVLNCLDNKNHPIPQMPQFRKEVGIVVLRGAGVQKI